MPEEQELQPLPACHQRAIVLANSAHRFKLDWDVALMNAADGLSALDQRYAMDESFQRVEYSIDPIG